MFYSIKKILHRHFEHVFSGIVIFPLNEFEDWVYVFIGFLRDFPTQLLCLHQKLSIPRQNCKARIQSRVRHLVPDIAVSNTCPMPGTKKIAECKVTVKHVSLFAQRKESYTFEDTRFCFFLLFVLKISCYVKWSLIQQNTSNKVNVFFFSLSLKKKTIYSIKVFSLALLGILKTISCVFSYFVLCKREMHC